METYTLDMSRIGGLTDEQFFHLATANKQLKLERTSTGEILIMALTGAATGIKNSHLTMLLGMWNWQTKRGKTFDSSTGFKLLNGAIRSPDAAFVTNERWNALTNDEQRRFAPLCPDFVLELMSESDYLRAAQDKMREWIENGCRLAWLLDTESERAYIYHPNADVVVIPSFDATLDGEDVLPGFALNLRELREPREIADAL